MSTVAERVAAGAAFLDEHDPGWWREDARPAIELAILDLESGCQCVLGQLYPCTGNPYFSYTEARHHLSLTAPDAESLGFDTITRYDDEAGNDEEYDALTAEWKRVIVERRTVVSS